ncbi:MAG: benzoate/H(+) symporter BenE family transporter [Actinomycetota bacterium]
MTEDNGGGEATWRGQLMPPIAAGLAMGAIYTAVLGIPLEAASALGLSSAETSSWIMVIYGLASAVSIVLILRYRQPLVVTGNIFILIFVLLLGGELSWPELVGATMVAGIIVLVLGVTGLTRRLALVLPAPIVYGLLAGAVLGLLADSFTALGDATLLVGATFAAYFLSRAFAGDRVPSLLVAIVVGVLVAVVAAETGPVPDPVWPDPTFALPQLTAQALLSATPVLVVFITLQANAPSIVYLRSQGYEAPERVVSVVSGAGTVAGSLFGPMGVSLSLPATALAASPVAGDYDIRHVAGYVAGTVGIVIAVMSGFAAELIEFIPRSLLIAVVGLATLGIFAQALREITKGPLLLGPVVAFAVAVSDIELMGLGRFFWALVLGLAVSLLLERDGWQELGRSNEAS